MSAPYPWQTAQWQALDARRRAGRLAHGLLLHGPEGTGKNDFAERFAQSLLCSASSASGEPCGSCQACMLIAAGTHPDLQRLRPEEDSKMIRVDQVRGLSARLSAKSQFGGFRVAIITPAERMNAAAANSLLKTLEEPGPDTVLLLVSAQPASLPATVRSRCQQLAFPVPEAEIAHSWVAARCRDEDPTALLALANHAPLAALRLAEEGGLAQREELFTDLLALLRKGEDPVRLAGKWQSLELRRSLDWLSGWICDLIRLQAAARPPQLGSVDRADELGAIARQVPPQALFAELDRLGEARRLMHTAVSPQAILESVLIPLRNACAGR